MSFLEDPEMTDLTRTALLTAEDLPFLPSREGPCELVGGRLVRSPPHGETHGLVAGEALYRLYRFVREHGLGRVYSTGTGFVLARDPDTVRGPDVAFVSAERLAPPGCRGFYFEGAPDLVVEVITPDDADPDVAPKVRDYLDAGARAVWVVDTALQSLTVHRSGRPPESFSRNDTVDGGAAVPGYRLPVREIFEP
jgi:Uma2 family endonuclease